MKTKIVSILCIIALVFTTIAQPTLADNVTQNSTPSTSTNVSDGEDFTQGEKTIYNNGTTLDTSEATEVYVSQSSTFATMIPKVIILGGQNGLATYEVYAKGNIGGTENIYIIPQTTLQLHDVKNIKSSLNGTITQEKTSFSWDDVMNEQKSIAQGTILVNGITAGNWISSFNFSISLEDTRTHIERISLADSTIVNEDTNAIQIQSSSNKEIPISIYPANSVDVLEATSSSPYVSVVIEEIEVSPITKTNTLIENLLLTNNVFAENENTKNIKLKVQVDEDAPCNLNATITLKSRTKVLEIPILVEHTYDNGVIIQEPNCITMGIKSYNCIHRDSSYTEVIQKTGHVFVNDICSICNFSAITNFSYTGYIQEYVVPETGYYKLETYGAQGGNTTTMNGGKGGYSVSTVYLNSGQILYIGVGGKGTYTATYGVYADGGYNGGGRASIDSNNVIGIASGGGATHIAFVNGTLREIGYTNAITNNNLIIASGGGGGAYYKYCDGEAGGGLYGGDQSSKNGNQTTFGVSNTAPDNINNTTTMIAGFGFGGYSINSTYALAGGGGGLYGGGAAQNAPSGGGSGYIGYIGNVLNASTSTGINIGNGKAIITFINN